MEEALKARGWLTLLEPSETRIVTLIVRGCVRGWCCRADTEGVVLPSGGDTEGVVLPSGGDTEGVVLPSRGDTEAVVLPSGGDTAGGGDSGGGGEI